MISTSLTSTCYSSPTAGEISLCMGCSYILLDILLYSVTVTLRSWQFRLSWCGTNREYHATKTMPREGCRGSSARSAIHETPRWKSSPKAPATRTRSLYISKVLTKLLRSLLSLWKKLIILTTGNFHMIRNKKCRRGLG